jgi:hypothetical protein
LEIAVPDGAHDHRLCPFAGGHLFAFALAFPETLMAATNMGSQNRRLGSVWQTRASCFATLDV